MVRQLRLFVDDAFFGRMARFKKSNGWTWEQFLREALKALEKQAKEVG